jgi:polysaccharide export outer membrane protein
MKRSILWIIFCSPVFWAAAQNEVPGGPEIDAYRLTPGDTIELRFFFNPELNDTVQIRPDGRISVQLIGEMSVGGLTVTEATSKIETLSAGELRTPKVSVQVRTFGGRKIFVTGEVVRPGPVNLPGEMTLLQAIEEAGGLRLTADPKSVVLIRKGEDGQPRGQRLAPYVSKDRQGPDAALPLQPFDIVMVPERGIARIDRWVDQHIKQLNPVTLALGFSYIRQNGALVPVF